MTREEYNDYQREWHRQHRAAIGMKPTPHLRGQTVRFDARALRVAIDRDARGVTGLARDIGIYPTSLFHILRKGQCRDNTLDRIACALGLHMSSLEVA